jgi:hypothetical protein
MKTRLKLLLNTLVTFAIIFFIVYLLMLIAAFFGCCTGITSFFYDKIVWVLLAIGILVFAFCFYNNCYKKRGDL